MRLRADRRIAPATNARHPIGPTSRKADGKSLKEGRFRMRKFALATVFALVGASGAFARSYSGDYTISFSIDPGATPGAQFCLQLTPAPGIGGITTSGNFVDTDGFGISGQYLLDGKSFHLVMLSTPADDNIDAIGRP